MRSYKCEWTVTRLGELGHLVRGVSYDKSDVFDVPAEGRLPVLRANNIQDGKVALLDGLVFVKKERIAKDQCLRPSDIVIAMSSGSRSVVGKAAMLESDWEGSFGAFCGVFRADAERADPTFVANVFATSAFREHIEREARGTNINNLTREHVLGYCLRMPPISEQTAIASALRAVLAASDARRRELEIERERKTALMEELFAKGLQGEPQRETEIGSIPRSWHVVAFNQVVNIAKGQVQPINEPYRSMLHVGPENIQSGTGRLLSLKSNSELNIISGNYLFTDHDVLYSKIRPYLNKVALPTFTGTCSADMYPLRAVVGQLVRDFLFHYLLSAGFLERIKSFQDRTGIPKVNRDQLSSVPLPQPPVGEQREIAEILTCCDGKIVALEAEAALLNELFRALLDDLMTGRVSALPLVTK